MNRGLIRAFCTLSAAVLCATGLGVLGSGGTAGAQTTSGSPIVIGYVGTDSGPYGNPEFEEAFAAYMNNWNAHGGFHGHPLKVISIDDQLSPTVLTDGARQLLVNDHAVAIVDSDILGCTINSFYQSSHVAVFGGVLQLPGRSCYLHGVDFPYQKTPGSADLVVFTKFAIGLGAKIIDIGTTSTGQGYVKVDKQFAKAHTKATVVSSVLSPAPTATEVDEWIAQAKAAGATAMLPLIQASSAALVLQEANRQNFGPANGIKYIFSQNLFSPEEAGAIEGGYTETFGIPWTVSNPEVNAALKVLQKYKVTPIDGLAESEWQVAGEFQQVLETITGPVTRASFLKAANHATSVSVPLTPGLKINMVHPANDPEGLYFLKDVNGRFVSVGGFTESKY